MPGAGPDDIIYQALVEDKTSEFFDKFDARVNQMANTMQQSNENMSAGAGKLGAIIGVVSGAVGALTTQVIQLGLRAVEAFASFVKEGTMTAARIEVIGTALEVVGNNAGYTDEQLRQYVEDVRKMGITHQAAAQSVLQMAQAELSLEEAAKLARLSQDAAVIANINSSQAFERITYAIISQQPEILRTMNLTIDAEQAYEKYAETLNKSVSSLTAAERKQAFMNAVMAKGKSIAGTYEAAMGDVGKVINSLARPIEDISAELGKAFTPALGVAVFNLYDGLKDLAAWLAENETELANFGEGLKGIVEWLLQMGIAIKDLFVGLGTTGGGVIGEAAIGIAKVLGEALDIASPEEIEARRSKLGEYFAQSISLLAAFAAAAATYVITFWNNVIKLAQGLTKALSGDFEGAAQAFREFVGVDMQTALEKTRKSFDDTLLSVGQMTGAIKDSTAAMEESKYAADDAAIAAEKLAEAMETAGRRLSTFARKMEDDAMELAISIQRRATEAAIREAWAREDMERAHQARLSAIARQAAQARADLIRNYARERLSIERDYQRRLRDMQKAFEFEASELARARDAVGLLRLMRAHEREKDEAQQDREDRLADAKAAFEEERKLMEQRIAEQLAAAQAAYAQQLADFERTKAREREIQELHDKWAEEDRQKQYAKQLAELLIQLQGMEGMTDEGLATLLSQWAGYFGALLPMAQAYMTALQRIITPTYNFGTPPGFGTPFAPPIIGQGGRVSQMMQQTSSGVQMDANRMRGTAPPPIPRVQASTSNRDRKEIDVNVAGAGLDPYIQRQVAMALLEIERNASGGR